MTANCAVRVLFLLRPLLAPVVVSDAANAPPLVSTPEQAQTLSIYGAAETRLRVEAFDGRGLV
jgi:hypothetical protein